MCTPVDVQYTAHIHVYLEVTDTCTPCTVIDRETAKHEMKLQCVKLQCTLWLFRVKELFTNGTMVRLYVQAHNLPVLIHNVIHVHTVKHYHTHYDSHVFPHTACL